MKFGSVGEVSQRYAANYAKWDDVPFPELATFFGYEGDVIDLEGTWRMSTTAAYDTSSAAPTVDDSRWPRYAQVEQQAGQALDLTT